MEASKRLWQIADELGEIEALVAENGGELTPELEARLNAMEGAFETKVENIALMVREAELEGEKAKAEKDRLAAMQKRHESTVAWGKRYLLASMRSAGIPKVETHRARVSVQKSSTPAIDFVGDIMELPLQYVRVIPESVVLDKKALADAMRSGAEVPDGVRVDHSYFVRIA